MDNEDKVLERKSELFVGGFCGDKSIMICVPWTRTILYRSGIPGDNTVYYYRGVGFKKYYRILGKWRWEGLDSFDTLFVE